MFEELHDQAMQNTEVLQPYSFKGLNENIIDLLSENIAWEEGIDLSEAREKAEQIMLAIPEVAFVLTNDAGMYGAAEILNDSVRQEIAEKVGDFYVLPSSIHETLIVPKDIDMELKELEQMVQEVNYTQIAPEERLSDYIYEYDAGEHELFRSDRAEERAKQKEEKREGRHERISVKDKLAEKKKDVVKMNTERESSKVDKKKEPEL